MISRLRLLNNAALRSLLFFALLAVSTVYAVDLVEHSDTAKTYGRIVGESSESVNVETDSGIAAIPLSSITGITYSQVDFTSPAKIAFEGDGAVIRRGSDTLPAEDRLLEKGDAIIAGPERGAGVLFVNEFQFLLAPNSSVQIVDVETESSEQQSLSLELQKGSLIARLPAKDAEKIRVAIRSDDCIVSIRSGVCAVEILPEEQSTAVDVLNGSAGVQSKGSDIGEVVVAEKERVLASGGKLMQDYLPEEKEKLLAAAEPIFLRRTVGEVEQPRVRRKGGDGFDLLSERLVLRGHNGFWLVPSVSASIEPSSNDYSFTTFWRMNPRIHLGVNIRSFLSLSLTGQYYAVIMNHDINGTNINRTSHQIIAAPRASFMFLRKHFFATASAAWINRFYLGLWYHGKEGVGIDSTEFYINYADLDLLFGPVIGVVMFYTGIGVTPHPHGVGGQATLGGMVRIFKGRILFGPQASVRLHSATDPRLVFGANLGTGLF